MTVAELDRETSVADLGGPALRTFFNLARTWQLSEQEQMKLLGLNSCFDPSRLGRRPCQQGQPRHVRAHLLPSRHLQGDQHSAA